MQLGRKVMMFMRTSDAAEIVDEIKYLYIFFHSFEVQKIFFKELFL